VLWIVKKNVWIFLNAIHAPVMKRNCGNQECIIHKYLNANPRKFPELWDYLQWEKRGR
jgi:hypothetical protein